MSFIYKFDRIVICLSKCDTKSHKCCEALLFYSKWYIFFFLCKNFKEINAFKLYSFGIKIYLLQITLQNFLSSARLHESVTHVFEIVVVRSCKVLDLFSYLSSSTYCLHRHPSF